MIADRSGDSFTRLQNMSIKVSLGIVFFHRFLDPFEIRYISVFYRQRYDFRHVVRVQITEPPFQSLPHISFSFDNQQMFRITAEFSLPPVQGCNRWNYVDAGCQTFFD
jgi:hypothetical protein